MNGFVLDKTVFEFGDLHDESKDRVYWLTRSMDERLAAGEMLRQMVYGYDPSARMERVLAFDELK